jgi:hypothetical protein
MNTPRLLASAAFAFALSSCGANPSDICASEEASSTISSEAKKNDALFEDIRAGTETPPYQSNKSWISQSANIQSMKKKSDALAVKLEEATATCISMDENASQQVDIEGQLRQRVRGGDVAGGIAGFGVGLAVGMLKPQIDAMSPARKRKEIWTPMCNGDFSPLHSDHSWGTAIADQIFPNRYAFWFNTVEKIKEEKNKLDQSISDAEVALNELENDLYLADYEKIKFILKDASLISKNDDETSFKCSANVTGVISGYSEAAKNLNYDVLITSEGKKKVSIVKDADYEALFVASFGE